MKNEIEVQENEKDLRILEEKLKYELFLGGDSANEEDSKLAEKLKNTSIAKERYPNVLKWKILMTKNLKI